MANSLGHITLMIFNTGILDTGVIDRFRSNEECLVMASDAKLGQIPKRQTRQIDEGKW